MTTSFINNGDSSLTIGMFQDEGKRPQQEDRLLVHEFQTRDGMRALLAMVADGIGGQGSGELASQRSVELIPASLEEQQPTASQMSEALKNALVAANTSIYEESIDNPQYAGMGTTCTAAVLVGKRLYLAHAGDSRLYLIRGGSVRQLTIDHTWAEEALRAGRSPEEIRNHPNRGVIKRFLGIEPKVDVDTRYRLSDMSDDYEDSADKPLFLEPGDVLLFCSDGVSDSVQPRQIRETLQRLKAQKAAEKVVDLALKAGASDNVSALVLEMPGGSKKTGPVFALPKWLPIAGLVAVVIVIAALLGSRLLAGLPTNQAPDVSSTPVAVAAQGLSTETPPTPQSTPTLLANTSESGALVVAPTKEQATETANITSAVAPTPTLYSTPTPAPTNTPQTTGFVRNPTSTPRSSQSPATFSFSNLRPTGQPSVGEETFSWEATPALAPNQWFELVFWPTSGGATAQNNGRSPVGQTKNTSVTASLLAFLNNKDFDNFGIVDHNYSLKNGDDLNWGVCIREGSEGQTERKYCSEKLGTIKFQSTSSGTTGESPGTGE